jgi:hypothetical protein
MDLLILLKVLKTLNQGIHQANEREIEKAYHQTSINGAVARPLSRDSISISFLLFIT